MGERQWHAKPHARRRSGAQRERDWRSDRVERRERGDAPIILYGWHPVVAALANPARRIRNLWATANAARRLAEEGISLPMSPELVRPEAIAARLSPDAVHQGLLAECAPLPSPALEDLPDAGTVLVLDQVTDPHNVGAILRTAAAFAVNAVILTPLRRPARAAHIRCERLDTPRPPQPGGDRRTRQIRLRRARTRTHRHRAKPRP